MGISADLCYLWTCFSPDVVQRSRDVFEELVAILDVCLRCYYLFISTCPAVVLPSTNVDIMQLKSIFVYVCVGTNFQSLGDIFVPISERNLTKYFEMSSFALYK